MSELQSLTRLFDADDVTWIHDGARTEKELVERGDYYVEFLFKPFPDLVLESGVRALEIGSGLGYIMEALERYVLSQGLQVGRIIGLDIAANMLQKAKIRLARSPFEYLHYDGVHIPLEDGSLDFIYSAASLQHIPKPFVYNLFLEIKRLLSPTGFSLFHLIGFSHIPHAIISWADLVRSQVTDDPRFLYLYSEDELQWVLGSGTGFKDVRVVEVDRGGSLAVAVSNQDRGVFQKPTPAFPFEIKEMLAEQRSEIETLRAEAANRSVQQANEIAAVSNVVKEMRVEFVESREKAAQSAHAIESALKVGWHEIQALKHRLDRKQLGRLFRRG